jgi:hypothetical protein
MVGSGANMRVNKEIAAERSIRDSVDGYERSRAVY